MDNAAVLNAIMRIINEAMAQHDRYVTINFFENGPFVTIYPLDEETTSKHAEKEDDHEN